jgi:hypothetical protein
MKTLAAKFVGVSVVNWERKHYEMSILGGKRLTHGGRKKERMMNMFGGAGS